MNCPLLLQDPLLYPQCWVVSWYQVESPRLQAPPADCRFPATRPRRLQSHSGRPHQDVMLQAASSRIAESSRHWLCTAVSSRQSPLSAYPVQSDKMSTHFRYSLQHSHQAKSSLTIYCAAKCNISVSLHCPSFFLLILSFLFLIFFTDEKEEQQKR